MTWNEFWNTKANSEILPKPSARTGKTGLENTRPCLMVQPIAEALERQYSWSHPYRHESTYGRREIFSGLSGYPCHLIETKGDYLDTVESQAKNTLGKRWAEKAGENYKYFMVFQSKEVPGTCTAKTIVDIMKML